MVVMLLLLLLLLLGRCCLVACFGNIGWRGVYLRLLRGGVVRISLLSGVCSCGYLRCQTSRIRRSRRGRGVHGA